jgi:hypothetical protein
LWIARLLVGDNKKSVDGRHKAGHDEEKVDGAEKPPAVVG